MNPEVKKLWTSALLSGEYQQAKGKLRDEGGFCCLGVLCDVYVKHSGNPDVKWDKYESSYTYSIFGKGGTIPDVVMEWAGLLQRDPSISWSGETHMISVLNDYEGLNFKQISQVIEEQL